MPTDRFLIWGPSRGGGRGEWGSVRPCSLKIIPNLPSSLMIFPSAPWNYFDCATQIPKSNTASFQLPKTIQDLPPSRLNPPSPHYHHQKPKPKSENHVLILLTAPLISRLVPQLPEYNSPLKINGFFSSQFPKTLERAPYMYMTTYN